MTPDKIDWDEFQGEPRAHITCACGAEWESYVKGIALIDGRVSITERPCPDCHRNDLVVRAQFDPEVWTLHRPNPTSLDREA